LSGGYELYVKKLNLKWLRCKGKLFLDD
jgi:hypothetical protein